MQSTAGALSGSHALPAGTLLQGGRYRIEQTLGQGGFAITYLAHDTALHRPVAIKELLPDGCTRDSTTLTVQPQRLTPEQFEQIRQRFLDEARLLAQLSHPSIVRVYDVFEAHNTGYLVMEYLQGHTLAELLRQRGGVMPEQEAVGYILQICDALEVVHQRGYLHRDIKPSNIIVTNEGRAVLIDFGAAREFAAGQTRGHTVALTPAYAPLEQYGALGRFDGRTDLYALGATLYHLVSGQPPLPAPDRAQGIPLPAPHQIEPRVSEAVSGVIMQALGLRMEERPASVGTWAQALEQASSYSQPSLPQSPSSTASNTSYPPQSQGSNPQAAAVASVAATSPPEDSPRDRTCIISAIVSVVAVAALIFYFAVAALIFYFVFVRPPREITVQPPPAGETISINEVIERVAENGVIRLETGTYTLKEPIHIRKSVRIVGVGTVRVISSADGYVIRCNADGKVSLENIWFIYKGSFPGNVCEVTHGSVLIKSCRFESTVRAVRSDTVGFGIKVSGNAVAEVRDSYVADNALDGIAAVESAFVNVYGTKCVNNQRNGIGLFGNATGEVRGSTCRNNSEHGIVAQEQSKLTAEGNRCEENKYSGIILLDSAAGELRGNHCLKNVYSGIASADQSKLTAEGNTCEGNKYSGISLFGSAVGEVRNNTCRNNGYHGIYAGEQSKLTAEGNTCEGNKDGGISLFGSAVGEVRNNTCRNNGYHGICAGDRSKLTAEGNTCEQNKQCGIFYLERAKGIVRDNVCRYNQWGLAVDPRATPQVGDNQLEYNRTNYYDWRQ